MKKIAIMPGHASYKEGSVVCAGKYKGWGENKLARYFLPRLADELRGLGYDVVCTSREEACGVTPSYSAKAANATGADIALEFHFNSCGNATGAEVLYWGYNKGTDKAFAETLGECLACKLGVLHRGALPCYEDSKQHPGERCTDNGWAAFNNSRMPFFMVEPCFAGSNSEDAEKLCAAVAAPDWEVWLAGAIDASIKAVYNK